MILMVMRCYRTDCESTASNTNTSISMGILALEPDGSCPGWSSDCVQCNSPQHLSFNLAHDRSLYDHDIQAHYLIPSWTSTILPPGNVTVLQRRIT